MDEMKLPKISENEAINREIEQMMSRIKSDEQVYSAIKELGLSNLEVRNNITKLYDYYQDQVFCRTCPGLNRCNKTMPRLQILVQKNGPFIDRLISPCKLYLKEMKENAKYIYADFPDEWKSLSLNSLNKTSEIRELMKDYSLGNHSWFYISGAPGTGKSLAAVLLGKSRANKNDGSPEIAVINAPERFKEMKDLLFNDAQEFEKVMASLQEIPILVIDEFGNEFKSDYIRDTIIFPLFQSRAKNNLLTIITSDFSFEEIKKMYSLNPSSAIRANQLVKLIQSKCIKEYNLGSISLK